MCKCIGAKVNNFHYNISLFSKQRLKFPWKIFSSSIRPYVMIRFEKTEKKKRKFKIVNFIRKLQCLATLCLCNYYIYVDICRVCYFPYSYWCSLVSRSPVELAKLSNLSNQTILHTYITQVQGCVILVFLNFSVVNFKIFVFVQCFVICSLKSERNGMNKHFSCFFLSPYRIIVLYRPFEFYCQTNNLAPKSMKSMTIESCLSVQPLLILIKAERERWLIIQCIPLMYFSFENEIFFDRELRRF